VLWTKIEIYPTNFSVNSSIKLIWKPLRGCKAHYNVIFSIILLYHFP